MFIKKCRTYSHVVVTVGIWCTIVRFPSYKTPGTTRYWAVSRQTLQDLVPFPIRHYKILCRFLTDTIQDYGPFPTRHYKILGLFLIHAHNTRLWADSHQTLHGLGSFPVRYYRTLGRFPSYTTRPWAVSR